MQLRCSLIYTRRLDEKEEKVQAVFLAMTSLRTDESKRLMRLLDTAPAPTLWAWKTYPPILGPKGKILVWKSDKNNVKLVEEKAEETVYVGLGFYCYVHPVNKDNLMIWYHVGPAVSPVAVRVHLFDTRGLEQADAQFTIISCMTIQAKSHTTQTLRASTCPQVWLAGLTLSVSLTK